VTFRPKNVQKGPFSEKTGTFFTLPIALSINKILNCSSIHLSGVFKHPVQVSFNPDWFPNFRSTKPGNLIVNTSPFFYPLPIFDVCKQ